MPRTTRYDTTYTRSAPLVLDFLEMMTCGRGFISMDHVSPFRSFRIRGPWYQARARGPRAPLSFQT
ncbi:MAG: hypothetical protein ACYTDU_04660 [Planctomycetota bacterium]